jgi:1,2-diacylglycerol 3-beta-galactosyltransferase
MNATNQAKRVLILTTTTGGGHKSAANAIHDSLTTEYGKDVQVEVVDVLKKYAPQPFDRVPEAYQVMQKMPRAWRSFYELGDGVRRAKIIGATIALYTWKRSDKLLDDYPSDVIISTYHLANTPVIEALARHSSQIPFITVVTDLVTAPPVWFDSRINLCVIPTDQVRELALDGGVRPDRIACLGMPVSSKFQPVAHGNRTALKERLGWPKDTPAILVMSGAEGVGALEQIALALAPLNATVIVITGKNTGLHQHLTDQDLPPNIRVYGFIDDMPTFMQASDMIVTKAGAATVMEALNSHLPIIFFAKLPGQEDGNVDYVVNNQAGFWAPRTEQVVRAASQLIENPGQLTTAQKNAARLSQPRAGRDIARAVGQLIGLKHT